MSDGNPSILDDPKQRAEILYILGIVPLPVLRRVAENVALIRKTINFGSVYIELAKGDIDWIGINTKERPPKAEEKE